MYAKLQLHPPYGFWKKIFKHFYENLPFLPHRQPIKFTDLDKSQLKRKRLLNKHFCKKNIQISPMRQKKIVNFLFSHYKSMGTISCHSNQSSYSTGIKNTTFVEANVLSMYASFSFIHFMVSEKKIFKHFYEN